MLYESMTISPCLVSWYMWLIPSSLSDNKKPSFIESRVSSNGTTFIYVYFFLKYRIEFRYVEWGENTPQHHHRDAVDINYTRLHKLLQHTQSLALHIQSLHLQVLHLMKHL